MKGRRAIKLRQLLAVIATSMIVGIIHVFYDYFLLHTPAVAAMGSTIAVINTILGSLSVYLVGGIAAGIFMVYFIQERLNQRPYVYVIAVLLAGMIGVTLVVGFIGLIPA